MQNLTDEQWQALANVLARDMAQVAPDWTAHNTHDPGITVLELLAYALTDLQYRTTSIDVQSRVLARHVAQLAHSLACKGGIGDCPPGLQRLNYFTGRVLSADDFTAEQDYIRQKTHRHNRALHGSGIVTGLRVTLERTGSKAQVVITPGLAFNNRGEEIEVGAPAALPLPARGKSLQVLLRYAEQPCRPVPAPTADPEEPVRFSRTAETFSASVATSGDDMAVALARVNFSRGRWALDRKFKPARVR